MAYLNSNTILVQVGLSFGELSSTASSIFALHYQQYFLVDNIFSFNNFVVGAILSLPESCILSNHLRFRSSLCRFQVYSYIIFF